ncbi:MAG: two-component system LytT family sensor kinase [Flavobacteriales bacterium]|jgi:two-component system LytT family sensor kinase
MKKHSISILIHILQLASWSAFGLLHLVFSSSFSGYNTNNLYNALYISTSGYIFSYLLRAVLRHEKVERYSNKKLISYALIYVLSAGALWEVSIILFHVNIIGYYRATDISFVATIFYFAYYSSILILWSLIYLGVKILKHRQNEKLEKLELKISLKEAQLNNLKWQMNPHFLFNSLNSVKALISEDVQKSKHMITVMASLLRYTLSNSEKTTVTFKAELEYTEAYLQLEKVRLEERLKFTIEIPDTLLHAKVLPMSVQTLAENAIKHGIATLPKGGNLHIYTQTQSDTLLIYMVNSGVLSPQNTALSNTKVTANTGTGLQNTRERLQLVFGKMASIKLTQINEHSVETLMTIPLIISSET